MNTEFNIIKNDPFIDETQSNAFGRDFVKSLKKTYKRRPKSRRPKTFRDRAKRAGELIPIVALGKAGISAGRKSSNRRRRRRPQRTKSYNNSRPQSINRRAQPPPTKKNKSVNTTKNDISALLASSAAPIVPAKQPMSKGLKIGLIAGGIGVVLITGILIFKRN